MAKKERRDLERERSIAYHERLAKAATPAKLEQDRKEMADRKAKAMAGPTTRNEVLRRQAEKEGRNEAAAIVELCDEHGKPELTADFLRRGFNIDQVKRELMIEGWADKLVEARTRVH